MKNQILSIVSTVAITLAASAQSNQIQNTINALKYNDYAKAKTSIDLASEHADTKGSYKTLYYRGKTYVAIHKDRGNKYDVAFTAKPDFDELKKNASTNWTYTFKGKKGNQINFSVQTVKGNNVTATLFIEGKEFKTEAANGEGAKTKISTVLENDAAVKYVVQGTNPPPLDPEAAEKAFDAFLSCMKLEKDNKVWGDEVRDLLMEAAQYVYFKGYDAAYTEKNYEKAYKAMDMIAPAFELDKDQILKRNNITPELIINESYKIALAAKDNARAKQNLQKLIDIKFKDPYIYMDMSNIYLKEKDTAKALNYIEQGRSIFDDNSMLLNAEIDLYIMQNKLDKLMAKTTAALESTPDDDRLNYLQGFLYEKKNDLVKAEAAYKKALETNPDNMDATYQIGALYFNKAVEINKKAEAAAEKGDMKKADVLDAQKTEEFKKALPYLEKTYEATPTDKATATNLLKIYQLLGDTEKAKAIKEKFSKKQ